MSDRLSVLSVGTLYPPFAIGGYEQVWRDVVMRLRELGHDVHVMCSTWRGADNGQDEDEGVERVLEMFIDDLLDVRSEGAGAVLAREQRNDELIRGALGERRPDVAFLGPIGGMPLGVIARLRAAGVPQLAFLGDEWPRYAPGADPWQRRLRRRGPFAGRLLERQGLPPRFRLDDIERWVCTSEHARQAGIAAGIEPERAVAIPPGPDRRRFATRPPHKWTGDLLYCGRLHPDKGVEHAIKALAELPGCTLRVAGAGDPRYAARLERVAGEVGVLDRVEMLGERRADLPDLYASADAVVFPSVWDEPWGLVPLESMAVGRPVVATGVGGATEYLRDGENALVVPPRDPAAIAAATRRLAESPELRARLVEGGTKTAEAYAYESCIDAVARSLISVAVSR